MKRAIVIGTMLVLASATGASADCTNNHQTGNFTTLISGTLICGRPGSGYAGNANDRWQEQHRADGTIWDHKLGVGNPVDPETQVGTWSVNQSAHQYTATYPSGSFTYDLYQISGTTYSFCIGSSEQVRATIGATGTGIAGAGCSSFPP